MILERLRRLEHANTSLIEWAYKHAQLQKGPFFYPFGFDGHEYLRELYEDPAPREVLEKAAQMGCTQYGLFRSLWFVDTRAATVLYFFDTDVAVVDFSNKRVKPVIERSDYLRTLCDDVNNVHMRKIRHGFLCFRGMFSPSRVRSIDADHIVMDELDVANQANKDQARERLSHSPWRWWLELSTPTTPNRGVDASWQECDQRWWHLACRCREGTTLEDKWPECIGIRNEGSDDEEFFLRCPKCGKEDLHPCEPAVVGEYRGWIPRRPEIKDVRGHHLSQLFGVGAVPGSQVGIPLREIWHTFKHTKNIPEFYNSKLGLPYAGDRVPIKELAFGDWGLAVIGKDVKIGIDQGDELHIVVLKVDPNTGCRKIINAVVVEGTDPWPDALAICRMYRDPVIVIDAMPAKHDARRLCEAFPGRAFMCYYSETQKDVIAQDTEDGDVDSGRKVTVHRTETLDRIVDGVNGALQGRADGIVFPNEQIPVCSVIKAHLMSLVKLKEAETQMVGGVKRETGEERFVYVHAGPDHFAHALNYANIAASIEVSAGASFDFL